MSKRLIRIRRSDILIKLEHHIGIELNAVLQNGNTHFGTLTSLTADRLTISDTRNHAHKLMISDIYEIVVDTTSSLENIAIK
jgi:hypothetical protein